MALTPIRRVVTGINPQGESAFIEDGPAPAVRMVPQRPGYRVTNLWCTGAAPAPVDAADAIAGHQGVAPAKGGTVLRIIDFPPEPQDPQALEHMLQATFASMYRDARHAPRAGEHPGMHCTRTVDYALMLEGELLAIMESSQTTLRAGDVLIQRGTRHAWANRSGRPARIAFVLVDGL
ncbi:cupin domain-containing protein [Verminephrobacter eiseniae]|uniref:cupin domain-containing protein n=1 Tax=Verminephrobacter eiseniae TaxID=364317 RepID=UPI00223739A3|nr:cupin domain-containing protein [Verminephrobacter eiseniae]MCW5236832.1 cupin domain-containing protein [Verminephrobacter eiseniae]